MRRFEVTEGTSHKFWQIDVTGNATTVCFGRLGTQGQSKTKHFANPEAAEREAQALIREKSKKGYIEVAGTDMLSSAPEPAPPPALSVVRPASPAVKATLRDRTGDELVIVLQGTLVILGDGTERLVQTLDSEAEAKEHFERVLLLRKKSGFVVIRTEECAKEAIVPPDILETQRFDGKIELANGRWTLTFLADPDEEISTEIAGALVGRLAEAAPRLVHIIYDFASPKQAWEKALSGMQLPSIEAFVFDTYFQTPTRQSANSIGDLAAVLRACPNLQRLFATGNLSLSNVTHPTLHTLHLLGNPLSLALAKGLGACTFPALDRLVLSLCADSGPGDQAAILDSIIMLGAPRLREVHLTGVQDVPDFLGRMATRGLPTALKVLSLSGTWHGAYELDDVRPILSRHAGALRSLQALGLVIQDDAELAEAQALWPFVRSAQQWEGHTLPVVYQSW